MRTKLLLPLLALAFAMGSASPAVAATINFTVTLDAAQAVVAEPGATGSGSGTLSLDTVTHIVTYDITWGGTQGTEFFTHLHGASAIGATSPARYFLLDGSPKQGTVQLTDPVGVNSAPYAIAQQEADLIAGLWYVNVHTTHSDQGEIRGQVLVAPEPGLLILLAAGGATVAAAARGRRS